MNGVLDGQNIEKIRSCWIHVVFMHFPQNGFKIFFLMKIQPPNQTAAENLEFIWQCQDKFGLQDGVEFMLNSCWIHAEFMHNQT